MYPGFGTLFIFYSVKLNFSFLVIIPGCLSFVEILQKKILLLLKEQYLAHV